jgi:hypothetical protein
MRKCSVLCRDLGSTDSVFFLEYFDTYSRYLVSSTCIFISFSINVNKFMLVLLYCYM